MNLKIEKNKLIPVAFLITQVYFHIGQLLLLDPEFRI
jgi:hypothetical protein